MVDMSIVYKVVGTILGLIVVLELLSGFSTTISTSATSIAAANTTYGPIALLFSPAGVIFTIFMVGILIYFVRGVLVRK